jgi:hypothetical protein
MGEEEGMEISIILFNVQEIRGAGNVATANPRRGGSSRTGAS